MNSMGGRRGGDAYLMGLFARVNYKLMDRYLLNASVRRDGHSAFSKDNRWANFMLLSRLDYDGRRFL